MQNAFEFYRRVAVRCLLKVLRNSVSVVTANILKTIFCVLKGTHFLCTVVCFLHVTSDKMSIKQAFDVHSCMFVAEFNSALTPACKMPLNFPAVLPFGVR